MAGKFNYEYRLKYPHLIGEDSAVWSRFILKFPDRFDTVDYDIHVGSGIATTNEPNDKPAEQWKDLTRKRIDVIGWKNDLITIIEVKNRVGLPTLGQILGYKFLFLRENPDILSCSTLIICSSIGRDDISVLQHYSIDFIVV